MLIKFIKNIPLPSQFVPEYPAAHEQVNEFTPSVQAPLLWHGFGEQSSISGSKNCITEVYLD